MKLYVQLALDDTSLAAVKAIQAALPAASGRLVRDGQLHMTVIHFGVTDGMYQRLRAETGITQAAYDVALARLITMWEQLQRGQTYPLQPKSFGRFGARGSVLVITYEPTPFLMALHSLSLAALRTFLTTCGVTDVDAFIRDDPALGFSLALNPHITLSKGFKGDVPDASVLEDQLHTLQLMPIRYEQ